MIKPTTFTLQLKEANHQNFIQPISNTQREEGSFRVNWITQKSQRQSITKARVSNSSRQQQLMDNHNIKYLKTCLQKEINLIPSNQNNDKRNNHLIQSQSSQPIQQKHSCDKKQKLSLMSKRPSLRKIHNFISFKEGQTFANQNNIENRQKMQIFPQMKQNQYQGKKEGKKCIRISSKRQCLAQITKN